MNRITRVAVYLLIPILAACTRMPVEYSSPVAAERASVFSTSDRALLSLIAESRVGAVSTHVDPASGLASTVRITSEYFSANGRSCRRFTQHLSNAARPEDRLACRTREGWQEIPIASIVE
jgi:hypothetical protein